MNDRLAVLISGRGSNLAALLGACADGRLGLRPALVLSNRPGAAGLRIAADAGIDTAVVDQRTFADRPAFDAALAERLERCDPALIALAGFMRILGADFVSRYRGRLLNIHPSLLPDFPGLNTHARALAAGVKRHGASVHYVTPQLDGGPVIAQASVAVRADDDPERLAARVLREEHRLYPLVLAWAAAGRLRLDGDRVLFDGRPLGQPLTPLETVT